MKSKILAIFTVFAVPLLYYYCDEIATLLFTALVGASVAIFSLWEQTKKRLEPSKLLYVFLAFLICWFLTVGNSVWLSCSTFASIPGFIKICILLLFTYSVSQELAVNKNASIWFYRVGALTGLLQGLYSIVEYIQAPPIPATWLDPASKELFRTRCCGILTDPNIYAAFLSVLFILTIALIIKSDIKKEQIWASVSLVLCGIGIMTTLSRGGWIGLGAALVAFAISMYISKNKPQPFSIKLLTISAIILLIIFFAGPFKYRFFSITKPSDMTFYQRTLINKGIFGAINKLPFWGHGLNTFSQVYPYYRIVGGDYPLYAHNEYLQSMIETGFVSSILLAALTLGLFIIIYKAAKQNKFNTLVFSAIFILILIQNLSGFSSRIFPTALLLAVSIGGILASQIEIRQEKQIIKFQYLITSLNIMLFALVLVGVIGSHKLFLIQSQQSKADSLIRKEKIDEAGKVLEKFLMEHPNNSSAANIFGMLMLIRNHPEKAIETWERAFEYNKFEAIFPLSIARVYSDKDEIKADSYYKKALELDPASENYRLEYSQFLIKQNKIKEAKEVLEKGLTYSPGFHNVYTGFLEMEKLLSSLSSK